MINHFLIIFIISASLITNVVFAEQNKTPVLFVLYDAGETLALTPVMQVLKKNNIAYKVLVMNTARILLRDSDVIDITTDCAISKKINPKTWSRKQALSATPCGIMPNYFNYVLNR